MDDEFDDEFDDDELDQIAGTALLEERRQTSGAARRNYAHPLHTNAPARQPYDSHGHGNAAQNGFGKPDTTSAAASFGEGLTEDFYDDDLDLDEVVDQNGAAFAPPAHAFGLVSQQDRALAPGPGLPLQKLVDGQSRQAAKPGRIDDGQLSAEVAKLQREKADLQKSFEDARSNALSKSGEIAIVRRNLERVTKDYELRIQSLEQTHAEALDKQRTELGKAQRERQKVEASNRFLEHELAQDSRKAKQTLRHGAGPGPASASTVRAPAQPAQLATPKKNRSLPLRDGFDDDDLVMLSPSKGRDRQKPATPKAGAKRRRFTNEQSPGQALQLSEPRRPTRADESPQTAVTNLDAGTVVLLQKNNENYQHVQKFLNYHLPSSQKRVVEQLAHYSFPSDPSVSMTSIFLDEIARLIMDERPTDISFGICEILLKCWSRCLKEEYFAPVHNFINCLDFVLANARPLIAIRLTSQFVPLAIATADFVALPNARPPLDSSQTSHSQDATKPKKGEEAIRFSNEDLCDIVDLLHVFALSCMEDDEALVNFWQHMDYDFVLLALNLAQPIRCIVTMLRLLSTSILSNTFGAISRPGYNFDQHSTETATIDRLRALLFNPHPTFASPENTYDVSRDRKAETSTEVTRPDPFIFLTVRLEVLQVFSSFCRSRHATAALISHPRLLIEFPRFLHRSLTLLYDLAPRSAASDTASSIVNLATRLLWHLSTSSYAETDTGYVQSFAASSASAPGAAAAALANLRARIAKSPGAGHMLLVALSRIAFSRRGELERGIEDEVMDAAHAMLDEFLTPEEGEAVTNVFGAGTSAGGGVRRDGRHGEEAADQLTESLATTAGATDTTMED